jgi:hypothetical protein
VPDIVNARALQNITKKPLPKRLTSRPLQFLEKNLEFIIARKLVPEAHRIFYPIQAPQQTTKQ